MSTRREVLGWLVAGSAAIALAGCTTSGGPGGESDGVKLSMAGGPTDWSSMYGAQKDGAYKLPAIPYQKVPQQYRRQIVSYFGKEKPDTIVVDTKGHHLYYIYPGRKAVRYGVGVGREGFAWDGNAVMQWKREWPRWTPPEEMIQRKPELRKYSASNGGMNPGLDNPLGARAMYLFADGKDTGYRLHGSPEWWSIGTNASSGCIRLMNQDVIDLYARVKNGTKVVVK